jgi:hypothetical protein
LDGSDLFADRVAEGDGMLEIEDEEQAFLQFVSPADQPPGFTLEGVRWVLERTLFNLDDIPCAVHYQAEVFFTRVQHECRRGDFLRLNWEIESLPEIDRGDDLSTQIDQSSNSARGHRNRSDGDIAKDLLDPLDLDSEEKVADVKGA